MSGGTKLKANGPLELAAGHAVQHDVCANPRVGPPLRQGASGALWKAAKVLTAASLVLAIAPGKGPKRRRVSGVLGVLGGLALRLAVFHAGKKSALDPLATFRQP